MPLTIDVRIELIHLPVTDVDRAKAFYEDVCGWPAEQDVRVPPDLRFVQITPPGSACSFAFGNGLGSTIAPGTLDVIQAVVEDADAALDQLRASGVEAQGVDEQPWGRFVTFRDPDGNRWTLQQLPPRP